jgi:hypothetical protein
MANHADSDEPRSSDPFTTGEDMLERAKKVARDIEEKVRKLTGETPAQGTPLDGTDEVPPLTDEVPPLT